MEFDDCFNALSEMTSTGLALEDSAKKELGDFFREYCIEGNCTPEDVAAILMRVTVDVWKVFEGVCKKRREKECGM